MSDSVIYGILAFSITLLAVLVIILFWLICKRKRREKTNETATNYSGQHNSEGQQEIAQAHDVLHGAAEMPTKENHVRKIIRRIITNKRIRDRVKLAKKKEEYRKRDEQLQYLLSFMKKSRNRMSGEQYEIYCAIMLLMDGFTDIDMTPVSGDFGADIIAKKNGERYCFQCKCYSQAVWIESVQEIYSARQYYECEYAAVMTNNRFTSAAMELAERLGVTMMDNF